MKTLRNIVIVSLIWFMGLVGGRIQAQCGAFCGLAVVNIGGDSAVVCWMADAVAAVGGADTTATAFVLIVTDTQSNASVTYNPAGNARSQVITGLLERTVYRVQLAPVCMAPDTLSTLFRSGCLAGGTMQVGSITGDATSSLPFNPDGMLSQQIFSSVEMEGISTISGIQVYNGNDSYAPSSIAYSSVEIYLDTTSYASYNSTTYIPQDSTHRVFSGNVEFNLSRAGWKEIFFDRTYTVPSGKNVVLTVVCPSASPYLTLGFKAVSTSPRSMTCSFQRWDGMPFDASDTSLSSFVGINSTYTIYSSYETNRTSYRFLTPCPSGSCLPPTITSVETDAAGVTLSWEANGASEWQVTYRTADDLNSAWTVATASTSSTSHIITGLTPAVEYVFKVAAICGTDTLASSVYYQIPCVRETLPFMECFESFNVNDPCWKNKYLSIENTEVYQGEQSLRLLPMDILICFALPLMEARVDSLSLDFWTKNGTSNGSPANTSLLEVGVLFDDDTRTPTDTLRIEDYDGWTHLETDFSHYSGPDGRIYLRRISQGTNAQEGTYLYIDSLTVDRLDDCRPLDKVKVTDVTTHTVTLAIEDSQGHDSYTVKWDTIEGVGMAGDSLTVTTPEAVLTGLTWGTKYYIYVRGNCGGSHGKWKPLTAYTTTIVTVTEEHSWTEDFEHNELTNMWQLPDSGDVRWHIQESSDASLSAVSGVKSAKFARVRDAATMLVLPAFNFSALDSNAEISMYAIVTKYPSVSVESSRYAARVGVYYRTSWSGDWTFIDELDTTEVNTWRLHRLGLPNSAGASLYQVALKGETMRSRLGVRIDDLCVSGGHGCREPADVVVRDISERYATVEWTGTAPAYKVQFREQGDWNWTTLTVEGQDTVVIAPLESNTEYEVRVISLCSVDEQSVPSSVVTFRSALCHTTVRSDNWSSGATDTVSRGAIAAVHYRGYYSEILVDSSTLAGIDGEIKGVSFYVNHAGDGNSLTNTKIYMYNTDLDSLTGFNDSLIASFTEVYSGSIAFSDTGERRVYFSTPFVWDGHSNVLFAVWKNSAKKTDTVSYAAHVADRNMVFAGGGATPRNVGYASAYPAANCAASNVVPNLTFLSCAPEILCHEPVPVTVISRRNSITVYWVNEGTRMNVAIKASDETEWDEVVAMGTANSRTFNGLTPGTSYDLRMRQICNMDDELFSEWVYLSAVTLPACPVPAGLSATDVSATTATMAWDGDSSASYELHVWNDAVNRYYDAAATTVTVDGLRPNESYHAAVRAHCTTGSTSAWSETVTFDNVCHPATNLTATSSEGKVFLSWSAGERNQQWIVTYGYTGQDRNQRLGYLVVDTTEAVIDSLQPGVSYGFRVVAVCGEDWQAGWTGAEVTATVSTEGIGDVDGSTISLYPNPASKSVTVAGLEGGGTVEVIDVSGRSVASYHATGAALTIDVSGYVRGTYFVRIINESATLVRKLVVK